MPSGPEPFGYEPSSPQSAVLLPTRSLGVVDDAFAKAEQRLGRGLRAQISAAQCRTA